MKVEARNGPKILTEAHRFWGNQRRSRSPSYPLKSTEKDSLGVYYVLKFLLFVYTNNPVYLWTDCSLLLLTKYLRRGLFYCNWIKKRKVQWLRISISLRCDSRPQLFFSFDQDENSIKSFVRHSALRVRPPKCKSSFLCFSVFWDL